MRPVTALRPAGVRRALALAALVAATIAGAPHALAQAAGGTGFQPQVGQSGKDVIWVPTPEQLVSSMLRMANVTEKDFVIDLGAGDGRIAIAAGRDFKARAMGIEYNPDMVGVATANAAKAGVSDRVKFVKADIFESDFSQATVITMYLLPSLNVKLRPKLLDMKPGTRLVSHAFDMGDWVADETTNADGRTGYLWIVPAKAAGTWTLDAGAAGGALTLVQTYQKLEGSLRRTDRPLPVMGSLKGDEIRFTMPDAQGGRREFVGRINGDRMEGTAGGERWTAVRTNKPG